MKKYITISQKLVSLILSFTLLTNSVVPAFSQAYPSGPKHSSIPPSSSQSMDTMEKLGFNSRREIEARVKQQFLSTDPVSFASSDEVRDMMQVQHRLNEIRNMFAPVLEKEQISQREHFHKLYQEQLDQALSSRKHEIAREAKHAQRKLDDQAKESRQDAIEQFISELDGSQKELLRSVKLLLKDTKTSVADRVENIAQKYRENSELKHLQSYDSDVTQWHEENTAKLAAWKEQEEASAQAWYEQELSKEEKQYTQVYEPAMLQEREKLVRQAVADLWAYKDHTPSARKLLLELGPTFLPLYDLSGKSFLNQEQKTWLLEAYRAVLQDPKSCIVHQVSVECEDAYRAIAGLGMLSNHYADGQLIYDLMISKYKTSAAVPVLLTGMPTLLVMERYDLIDSFFARLTKEEGDVSKLDMLSLEMWVSQAQTAKGKYLGEVSQYGQYPLEQKAGRDSSMGNVYEDIAQLLAQDGSTQSLALLKRYGVEQCRVRKDSSANYTLHCAGLIPFLAGALISGKSGAEQYKLQDPSMRRGSILNSAGRATVIDAKQAAANAQYFQNMEKWYYGYAKSMGLTPAGMLARHLFLQEMGDLNPETELHLDNLLYTKAYQPTLKIKTPKKGIGIRPYTRDSEIYKQKVLKVDEFRVLNKIARAVDVAILLWCLVDITKWAYSGAKISYALLKSGRMARAGAPLWERRAMLRKMRVLGKVEKLQAFPHTMLERLAPTVSMQMPQFTAMKPIKLAEGAVETGAAVAKGMVFNATKGSISLTSKENLLAQGVSASDVSKVESAFATASQTAAQTLYKTKLSFGQDRKYRKLLLSEMSSALEKQKVSLDDIGLIMEQARQLKITAPKSNIPEIAKHLSYRPNVGIVVSDSQGVLSNIFTRAHGRANEALAEKKLLHITKYQSRHPHAQILTPAKQRLFLENRKYRKLFEKSLTQELAAAHEAGNLSAMDMELLLKTVNKMTITAPAVYVERHSAFAGILENWSLLKEGIAFSAAEGKLLLSNKEALRATGTSDLRYADLEAALGRASTQANLEFHWHGYKPGKDRAYKHLLLTELEKELTKLHVTTKDMDLVMRHVKNMRIHVPNNIQEFAELARNTKRPAKKLLPLLLAQGLSLSSASTGLIAPLEQTYGDQITETKKMLIATVFPFVPSALCIFVAPLVSRVGALNTMKVALGTSTAGLLTAAGAGFYGNLDSENLPKLWPLYVSGISIGISSTLSRASLNVLIDSMGGGTKLLQSMMYKNLGSVALLAPPLVASVFKPDVDFSFAFPVLAGLSIGSLSWISKSGYYKTTGKDLTLKPLQAFDKNAPKMWIPTFFQNAKEITTSTLSDVKASFRLVTTKEVLPLMLATTAFTGFEAAALNKGGNQVLKKHVGESGLADWVGPEGNRKKNMISFLAGIATASIPFAVRANTPKILTGLRSPASQTAEYTRTLIGSYGLNIGGGVLLYANGLSGENAPWGWLGFGMLAAGTAQVTQSFQKIANFNITGSKYLKANLVGKTAKQAGDYTKSAKDKVMTTFSTSQLGLAAVPYIVGKYTDRQIEDGVIEGGAPAALSSMWIPLISIGASFLLAAPTLRLLPHVYNLPTGTVAATKGLFGSYPVALKESFSTRLLPSTNLAPREFIQAPALNPVPHADKKVTQKIAEDTEE